MLFYPITLGGRRGTTDEFATIPFHLDLFSAALVELAKSFPVHSLILSNIGTMKKYSRRRGFELVSVNHSTRSGGTMGISFRVSST